MATLMNGRDNQQVGTFGISRHLPEWTCFFQVFSFLRVTAGSKALRGSVERVRRSVWVLRD
jgi:hypothetical protein